MQPTAKPAAITLSSLALAGIAGVGTLVLSSIFTYILFVAPLAFDGRLWWIGFASGVFALAFFAVYAATHDRRVVRPLTGGFFLLSVVGFYGSIYANPDSQSTKLIWIVVLSILVAIPLVGMYVMARQEEADAARRAQRKVTP